MSQASTLGRPDRPDPEDSTALSALELERSELARSRTRSPRHPLNTWPLRLPARAVRAALWPTLFGAFIRAFYRLETVGVERFSAHPGPVIFASNHCAHLDNAFIIVALPTGWRRRLAIAAAAADIFGPRHFGLPLKGTFAQLFGNAFPFSRGGGAPPRVEHLSRLLDRGWSVLIFPEGRLTVCGPMQRFKPGIGLIAVETGTPVVPVRLDITRRGPWEGAGRFSRGSVIVRFGHPLSFGRFDEPETVTRRIEEAVRAL